MLNPLALMGMTQEAPVQWWQRVGTGYHDYLKTLQGLGVSTAMRAPTRADPTLGMNPALIQQLLNRTPNVITFGGAQ